MKALLAAVENPAKLLEVCAAITGDRTSAVEHIADAFQFTELQASAVLDMQIRRFTPQQTQLLRNELSECAEHLAEQLIVHTGARVAAFGHLERGAPDRLTLWVAFPWDPLRWPYRTTGGDIPVERADPSNSEVTAGLVRVEGVWTGKSITQATVESVGTAPVAALPFGVGEATPAELGADKFVEISSRLTQTGAAPFLGGGGTAEAMWQHVLYMTPELVDACKGLSARANVFPAISPA